MAPNESKDIQVTFTNYNYSFEAFYSQYKEVCLSIIDNKNLIDNIREVTLFFYEYDYSISDMAKRQYYHSSLKKLKDEIAKNKILELMNSNKGKGVDKRNENLKIYFIYLIKVLDLLSEFVAELTSSFMPRTNLQKKKIRYANNQLFFQKFGEVKKIVLENLSTFKITEFVKPYKSFLVYYYAYSLYVDDIRKKQVSKHLSLALSYYCNKDLEGIFKKYPSISENDKRLFRKVSDSIMDCLSVSNSILNQSFSNYGILPKLNEKVLIDTTGI